MVLAFMAVGAVQVPQRAATMTAGQFKVAVALPGSGLGEMSPKQSARLFSRVSELVAGGQRDGSELGKFVTAVRTARLSGVACRQRYCGSGWTVKEVCCRMGALMRRQRELEQVGRRAEVGAFLRRLADARRSGLPEAKVQQMAREAQLSGALAPGAARERARLQQELDGLTRQLVETGMALARPTLRPAATGSGHSDWDGTLAGPALASAR